ncbi:MAG: preprotein translocase subunit SecG [Cytophagales bacterium]|nr:preprotein translocase subunit SecG [Cytophagales bacterium]
MFTFIITLIIIASLLLILVVLAQNSKGGGLSSQFGGGGTSQVMGVKRTGDLLEKMTWGLAMALLGLSLSTHIFMQDNVEGSGLNSSTLERAEEQTILPPSSTPLPIEGTEAGTSADDTGLEGLMEESDEQ